MAFELPAHIFDWPEMAELPAETQMKYLRFCCEYFFKNGIMTKVAAMRFFTNSQYDQLLKVGLIAEEENDDYGDIVTVFWLDNQWSFETRCMYAD